MEIKGKIERLGEVKIFTKKDNSDGQKREFIVSETGVQYPQRAKFTALNKNVDSLDSLQVGDEVEVKFNINATDFNENTFNNLNAYSIKKL